MHRASDERDPSLPLSCLRLLVPPLRLASAAVWEIVQNKVVASYGLLDDFVTAVTEIVPELLSRRQRCLLSLGLRFQATLELCRPEQTIDLERIQPHLDVITSLWNTEVEDSDDSASSLLGLIHTLIEDQEEREHFFQDVFPLKFGDKYSEDLQKLVEMFLSQLDKLLTVPKLKQIGSMLSDAPSVLSDCMKSCQSQELKSLLEYQKGLSRLNNNANPKVGTKICSALSLPPLKTALTKQKETLPEANVLTDYIEALNEELTVETCTDDVKMESVKPKSKGAKPKSRKNKTCPTCGKTYSRASDMRRHERTHTGEKPFQCLRCEKYFQRRFDLKKHELHACKGPQSLSGEPSVLPHQGEDCDQLKTQPSNIRTLEEESLVNQKQGEATSVEVVPLSNGQENQPLSSTIPLNVRTGKKEYIENQTQGETSSGELAPLSTGQDFPPISRNVQLMDTEQSHEPHQDHQRDSELNSAKLGKATDASVFCEECNRWIPGSAQLTHNERHIPQTCTKCGERFKGFIELQKHYIVVHDFRGPYPCTLCKRTYSRLKYLVRHEGFHTGDHPFKCPKCPKVFDVLYMLREHDRTHTKEAPFLCWDCGKRFKSNRQLKEHRLIFHSSAKETRFCCEHCGKEFALKSRLDRHVARMHTEVRYPCSHCGKLCLSKTSLIRHNLTHSEEKPFSCGECSNSFRSASELKVHIRYHTGERPFRCKECGRGFVQAFYLTAHMRKHTGETPYKCPTCEKDFATGSSLNRHVMTHTKDRPHKCPSCERSFIRRDYLRAHVKKIH